MYVYEIISKTWVIEPLDGNRTDEKTALYFLWCDVNSDNIISAVHTIYTKCHYR